MKRFALIFVAVLLSCSLAFAAGAQEKKPAVAAEKVISFNIGQEPTTLDPGLNSGVDGSLVLNHMYEGLMVERNNEFVPAAAESYTVSEDGKVYTFHLKDAKWSDGVPVRAQDFEFAWKRALDPAVASSYSWIFDSASIDTFEAVDDKTFVVHLKSNNPVFLSIISNTTFFPLREDKIDYLTGGWALDPEKVVTNGPFTLAEYKAGDKLVMTRNPHYYDAAKVKVDKIIGYQIVDLTTALTTFEAGEIDAITEVPPAEKQRLMNEDPNFMVSPLNKSGYYAFNIKRAPFDDIRVRKAFSYAVNREDLARNVLKGGEEPAHGLVPSVIYDNQGRQFNKASGDYGIPADGSKVAEARKLLAEAGYPDGKGFPEVELLYIAQDQHKANAEAIQQMWKNNLGVTVNLVNMESSVFHQTRVAHNFDICWGGWNGDYNDPLTHLELYVTGNPLNYADWSNPEFDALIKEGANSSGDKRFDDFYKAEKLLMEDFAYIPVYYGVYTCMINKDRIKDYEVLSTGVYRFAYSDVIE